MKGLSDYINNWKGKKVLVIGDIMMDRYIWGKVTRISPEAPVPVVKIEKETITGGGAANVAKNIASLGGNAILVGTVGNDPAGTALMQDLQNSGITTTGIFTADVPTTQKIRVMSSGQQLFRMDDEEIVQNPKEAEMIAFIQQNDAEVILLSDYMKGCLTSKIIKACIQTGKKVIADTKMTNVEPFKGAYLIKPNQKEAEAISNIKANTEENLNLIGNLLIKNLESNVLITRGKDGMSLFEREGSISHIPTQAKEVFDIAGAGDTAAASLALSVAGGANLKEATIIANHACGIVVGKRGTATVSDVELKKEFEKEHTKFKAWDEMKKIIDDLHAKGKKVVFTNGCFDILHYAHTRLFKKSKALGDVLVVALNTDESIKRRKGPSRPVLSLDGRAEVLSALEPIDFIVSFDDDLPNEVIDALKPDVVVKGSGTWTVETMPEAEVVKSYGGEIKFVETSGEIHTSDMLKKLGQ